MTYIYYLLQRPPAPGAFPKPQGNHVLYTVDFGGKVKVETLGCPAWGYVEYDKPVSPYLLQRFDMAATGAVIDPCEDCKFMQAALEDEIHEDEARDYEDVRSDYEDEEP